MAREDGYWRGYPSHLRSRGAKSNQETNMTNSVKACAQTIDDASYESRCVGQQSQEPRNQTSPHSAPQQTPAPQIYTSGKSHVSAGLLAIFLGSFGIHKFYLGYNSAGFIMLAVTVFGSLISFGLAGCVMVVVGFVEGIIYLATGQQAFERTYVNGIKEWF